jgi:uncharacterized protein YjbI with pentapeptide repeats
VTEAPLPPGKPKLSPALEPAAPAGLGGGTLERARLEDADLAGLATSGLHLDEVELRRVDLSEATLAGLEAVDLVVAEGSWANVRAERASLRRGVFRSVRLTGAALPEAELVDVSFEDCRLDLAGFRFARLERVAFVDCRLEEADLQGAVLENVRFERCGLERAVLSQATLVRCELRGCTLDGLAGAERLAGARLPWPDVVAAAGTLAAALGIDVVD